MTLTLPVTGAMAETEYLLPTWGSPAWMDFASHIVAGEAADTDEARLVTACTLRHDVERGWSPWLLRNRWFGWKRPADKHREAVHQAMLETSCLHRPRCKYVGNLADLAYWRRTGMVGDVAVLVWMDTRGKSTVCVPFH